MSVVRSHGRLLVVAVPVVLLVAALTGLLLAGGDGKSEDGGSQATGFRRAASAFISGEALCAGNPALAPGVEVELDGVSPRMSGRYRVSACSHHFAGAHGYETRINLSRGGWNG